MGIMEFDSHITYHFKSWTSPSHSEIVPISQMSYEYKNSFFIKIRDFWLNFKKIVPKQVHISITDFSLTWGGVRAYCRMLWKSRFLFYFE